MYLFSHLRATSYIWGSRLTGTKHSSPDVSQLTGIRNINYCCNLYKMSVSVYFAPGGQPTQPQNVIDGQVVTEVCTLMGLTIERVR
jgi:hypothetical protein